MTNPTRQKLIEQLNNLADEAKLKNELKLASILYFVCGIACFDFQLDYVSEKCQEMNNVFLKLLKQLKN